MNPSGELRASLNLHKEFQINQSENKVGLGKQGRKEWEGLLKDFLPGMKVFTFRFAYDLHIICVWLQSLSVVQIMFKLKLISRRSVSSPACLSLPVFPYPIYSEVRWKGQDFQTTRVVPGSRAFCVSNPACDYAFYCHKQKKPGQGCPEGRIGSSKERENLAELARGELAR